MRMARHPFCVSLIALGMLFLLVGSGRGDVERSSATSPPVGAALNDPPLRAPSELRPATLPAGVSVADLVRAVRQSENWVHEIKSLSLRIEGRWTVSSRYVEQRRAELRKQFGGEPDAKRFPELLGDRKERLELAFDQSRLRLASCDGVYLDRLHVWDGKRFIAHERYLHQPQEHYTIDRDTRWFARFFLQNLVWLRAQGHAFWWIPEDEQVVSSFHGEEREFVLVGRDTFCGVDCYVLEYMDGWRRWYVGVEDRLLHGQVLYVTPREVDRLPMLRKVAGSKGKAIESVQAGERWMGSLPEAEQREVMRQYRRELLRYAYPLSVSYLLEYRQLRPGNWMPMQQGYWVYDGGGEEKVWATSRYDLSIVEAKVDQPLPDELFAMKFKEGVEVQDWVHEPPLRYTHKETFTRAEWNAIVAKAVGDGGNLDQVKRAYNSLIGKGALAFPADSLWLNAKPMKIEDLKGKVVLLYFLADWCEVCRKDLPLLAQIHASGGDRGIVLIGIHTAGSAAGEVEASLKQLGVEYPVCVDRSAGGVRGGWGVLCNQYKVKSIPHACVIDADGTVAGNGSLEEVMGVVHALTDPLKEDEAGRPKWGRGAGGTD